MRHPHVGRGSNSANLRRYNERLLLQALRRMQPASKADLARSANLTSTSVGSIIASLEQAGLIESTGRRVQGLRGQPASLLQLAPQGAFGIGVRLDRGGIETVLVNFAGEVLARRSHDMTLPAPAKVLALVGEDIRALLDRLSSAERERLTGIGVAQPFNLGCWLRELGLSPNAFDAWHDVDFASELASIVPLPVFSENDGNAAAIAELFYGCGRQASDFIYLFLGPAIGGGIAIDGDCLRGANNNAGAAGEGQGEAGMGAGGAPELATFNVKQTNLDSDQDGAAQKDPNLVNAWGIAINTSAQLFWVASNHGGSVPVYDATVAINAALPSTIIFPGFELEVAVCCAIESDCERIIRNHITGES